MEVIPDEFFKLRTRNNILKQLCVRSQFEMCHERVSRVEEITLRSFRYGQLLQAKSEGMGKVMSDVSSRRHVIQKNVHVENWEFCAILIAITVVRANKIISCNV